MIAETYTERNLRAKEISLQRHLDMSVEIPVSTEYLGPVLEFHLERSSCAAETRAGRSMW